MEMPHNLDFSLYLLTNLPTQHDKDKAWCRQSHLSLPHLLDDILNPSAKCIMKASLTPIIVSTSLSCVYE